MKQKLITAQIFRYMRIILTIAFFSMFSGAIAQNKSLGVGTATPNVNAALHVESPTNNQGFIMPRLTTSQRTAGAFTSVLSPADVGLMVYDTDLLNVFVWEGSDWYEVNNLDLPYTDTISSAPNGSNLLRFIYTGSAVENVGVAQFENLNPNNGFTPLFARTNSATNGVVDLVVNNVANNNDAIGVVTNGIGRAGAFSINNSGNISYAVLGQSNGGSLGAAVHGNNTGNGFGVFGKAAGSLFGSAAVYGEHVGTGDAAGAFRISNPANTFSALFGETNGSGPSVYGKNIGTGNAGFFEIETPSSISSALFARTFGTGRAASLQISNATSTAFTLQASTNGLGRAGNFIVSNTSNTGSALYATTNGTSSTSSAFRAEHTGDSGYSGIFQNMNAANNSPSLFASTASNGAAFHADTDQGGNAIEGVIFGTGTGSAGFFENTNTSSTSNTLVLQTNGTGAALFANHYGASGNIAILQSNGSNVARVDKTGQGFFNGGTVSSGADVAEMFDVEGERNTYEPGDVLVISENTDRTVEKSNVPNSTKVAGVYATKPGVILTEKGIEENLDQLVPMGVVGVIPTKVCLENGPIMRGDLLVTSSTNGHAMKAIPVKINGVEIYPTGAILGKALENFSEKQTGLIKVLVNVK
jgi:hypothetical protein